MKAIIKVRRIKAASNSMLSKVYINGEFFCYGLEDAVRDQKIKGRTAIPAGTYPIRLNTYGGMNSRYKKHFPKLHRGMLEITQIPDYSYVYIHIGNNFGDTSGCLLVGFEKRYVITSGEYEIFESKAAYRALYKKVLALLEQGEVWLEIGF
ncbi:DUF5675 family protein [Sphingobacterium athyrii]|uniref:Cyclic nucleotide-binding domain-containing protein n=1 Tax=Sphingobacterium athyrii TaxID=2152717 RepID=A0A363NUY3_9SPHI|nr:DUF5675 family protein [Sphingobacterium athyrii]PUV24567.1 hypothetical protein DCO56_14595 [Sphingobacterium athyrii]